MPPLCTVGYGLGSEFNTRIMGGASLLFLTNLVAIVVSAFAIFLLTGMNSPEVRGWMELARKDEPMALWISHGRFARVLANSGKLRWRILLLAVLLATIYVPLRTAFVQVAQETMVRGTVQDVVSTLLPSEALVSQQVQLGQDSVAVRLISTEDVPEAKLHQAEEEIERRSGRRAQITVSSMASQSEFADLLQRLAEPPSPPPPKPEVLTVEEMQQQLMARVQPVVAAVWPPEAPLQSFNLQLSPGGITVNAQYASYRRLAEIPLAMIERQLQQQLALPGLTLKAERVPNSLRILEEAKKKASQAARKSGTEPAAKPLPGTG
jgi:hypothetical protein